MLGDGLLPVRSTETQRGQVATLVGSVPITLANAIVDDACAHANGGNFNVEFQINTPVALLLAGGFAVQWTITYGSGSAQFTKVLYDAGGSIRVVGEMVRVTAQLLNLLSPSTPVPVTVTAVVSASCIQSNNTPSRQAVTLSTSPATLAATYQVTTLPTQLGPARGPCTLTRLWGTVTGQAGTDYVWASSGLTLITLVPILPVYMGAVQANQTFSFEASPEGIPFPNGCFLYTSTDPEGQVLDPLGLLTFGAQFLA